MHLGRNSLVLKQINLYLGQIHYLVQGQWYLRQIQLLFLNANSVVFLVFGEKQWNLGQILKYFGQIQQYLGQIQWYIKQIEYFFYTYIGIWGKYFGEHTVLFVQVLWYWGNTGVSGAITFFVRDKHSGI